jgi:ribosomal protein S18 acetylase RimI-like enzyme
VLAEAFTDDPVWTALGPRRRAHRRLSNRVSFAGILAGSLRNGARIRVARDERGRVLGASIAFEPGRWPISEGSIVWELGWVFAAGPLPAWRGFRDDRAMRSEHVTHPHMYLWFLGVHPDHHGRGTGRALLADLHARSAELAVPTFLETGSPENVSFYERLGYEVLGQIEMPSGTTMWRMERPAALPAPPG